MDRSNTAKQTSSGGGGAMANVLLSLKTPIVHPEDTSSHHHLSEHQQHEQLHQHQQNIHDWHQHLQERQQADEKRVNTK